MLDESEKISPKQGRAAPPPPAKGSPVERIEPRQERAGAPAPPEKGPPVEKIEPHHAEVVRHAAHSPPAKWSPNEEVIKPHIGRAESQHHAEDMRRLPELPLEIGRPRGLPQAARHVAPPPPPRGPPVEVVKPQVARREAPPPPEKGAPNTPLRPLQEARPLPPAPERGPPSEVVKSHIGRAQHTYVEEKMLPRIGMRSPDTLLTPHRGVEGMMRLPEIPQELVRTQVGRAAAPPPPARGPPEPLHAAGVVRAPLPPEIAKLLEWRRELVEKLRRRQPQPV